ncbi:MAG: nickel pincer cofactor biosynthesis protein LarC [Acidobacteriaceae bacterium]
MKIAYLDCFAGISGDMFLGALIDAGVPAETLQQSVAALGLGASISVERVDRSGISCTRVRVLEHGKPVEPSDPVSAQQHTHAHDASPAHTHPQEHTHTHEDPHPHTHPHDRAPQMESAASANPASEHHHHGRSLSVIRSLIQAASLPSPVQLRALRAFELLAVSEAKIHNVGIEEIHFHEVGAVDAIVDIVASCAGIEALAIDAWYSSPLNVGSGMVVCAHGTFPVPAPATADLLRGLPTYSAHVAQELVTPTGAALVRALEPVFATQPAMRVQQIGYGAGSRNPKGFPNVLRLSVGETSQADLSPGTVSVLETALDDLSPQILSWVADSARAAGAVDVMLTPVIMKKGRSGVLLTVLCHPAQSEALQQLILRETSTLGVRVRQEQRVTLQRRHQPVQTPYGEIRIKLGEQAGEEWNAAPEFEDCRAAAERCGTPLKHVYQAALAAHLQQHPAQPHAGPSASGAAAHNATSDQKAGQ